MRLPPIFVCLALLPFGPAQAEWGEGDYPTPDYASPPQAISARQLRRIGSEAIRFSSNPALGGSALVIEISRGDEDWSAGKAYFLYGHRSLKWKQTGSLEIGMLTEDYDWLAAELERLAGEMIAEDHWDGPEEERPIAVCADGPGYVLEFRRHSQSRWFEGSCGSDATYEIAALMARVMAYNLSDYTAPLDRTSPTPFRDAPDDEE